MTVSPFSREFQRLASDCAKNYKAIAAEMNVSPALLARVLNGSRPPTTSFVESCIRVFELPTDRAAHLKYLAAISQEKLSLRPKDADEATKIVAFFRELRGDEYLPE